MLMVLAVIRVAIVVMAEGRERRRKVPDKTWFIILRRPTGRSVLFVVGGTTFILLANEEC